MMLVAGSYKYFRYYLRDVPEMHRYKMLEEMNGHTRNQLITEFLMHYLKTGSEDDMKAADIIADEVFEHTLKRIDELERQVRMLTTGRENIDGNKIWKKFHSEDISINELNEE